MSGKHRSFNGLIYTRDNFMYAEHRIDWEVRKARKSGLLVRRIKAQAYKKSTGNWWHLYWHDPAATSNLKDNSKDTFNNEVVLGHNKEMSQ